MFVPAPAYPRGEALPLFVPADPEQVERGPALAKSLRSNAVMSEPPGIGNVGAPDGRRHPARQLHCFEPVHPIENRDQFLGSLPGGHLTRAVSAISADRGAFGTNGAIGTVAHLPRKVGPLTHGRLPAPSDLRGNPRAVGLCFPLVAPVRRAAIPLR